MKDLQREDLSHLNAALNSVPAIKSDFLLLMTSLKRRQLSGSQQCAKATLEVIRSLLGRYNFNSADHMIKVVRSLGRELSSAAQSEFSIGNLVRRILFFIREEHSNQASESSRIRSSSKDLSKVAGSVGPLKSSRRERSGSGGSSNVTRGEEADVFNSEPVKEKERENAKFHPFSHSPSLDNLLGNFGDVTLSAENDLTKFYPGLKGAVISAINEMSTEIDNHVAISQRAQDYIHSDECILTFGYSRLVELFLRAAAAKRRFQLIIAEGAPGLEGHKLAQILSKVPAISVTVIPDSNIYAIMARINKVVLSPQAIMADGGAISSAGHYMVALAAKEFSVPVVCVSAAFSLTPLFAHNQSNALQQLLSPSSVLPYNANLNYSNVEVSNPAFDHIPPDLISLYVTNDGSQLPSYVFRQLSEYYHPHDYVL